MGCWGWFLISGIGLLIIVVASGWFDPQPLGQLQWAAQPVAPPQAVTEPTIIWLERPLPPPPYTIRLTAAWQSGHPDSAYGLALGSADAYVLTAVTPTGYLLLPISHPQPRFPILPWPHINQLDIPNEIWLDVTAETIIVRLNRELYGEVLLTVPPGRIGLWGMSWEETAVIDFQRIELFQ